MYVARRDPLFRKLVRYAGGDVELVTKAIESLGKLPKEERRVSRLRDEIDKLMGTKVSEDVAA